MPKIYIHVINSLCSQKLQKFESNSDEKLSFYINATKAIQKSVENYNYFKPSYRILW